MCRVQQYDIPNSKKNATQTIVSATLRYFTFDALSLTHTCHSTWMLDQRLGLQEVREICDEEPKLLDQLERLVVEINTKYDGFSVGLTQFLGEYREK